MCPEGGPSARVCVLDGPMAASAPGPRLARLVSPRRRATRPLPELG
jgi:hypothetical protein